MDEIDNQWGHDSPASTARTTYNVNVHKYKTCTNPIDKSHMMLTQQSAMKSKLTRSTRPSNGR